MLTTVGLCLIVVGWSLQPPYVFSALVAMLPRLWQVCFIAAGTATLLWAARPQWRWLYMTSGLLVLASTSTRAAALVILADQWAGIAWAGFAALAVWSWPRVHDEMR